MPASDKQIAANRQNAKKSTGPKSASGKAASSLNALKHGLYASNIVVASKDLVEDAAEYELLVSSLKEELSPETVFQECIVRKIANCLWRSRRVTEAEAALIEGEIDDLNDTTRSYRLVAACQGRFADKELADLTEDEFADLRARIAARELVPHNDYTINLTRYEFRLDRQLIRMFQFYQDVKMMKAGKSSGNSQPEKHKNEKTNPLEDSVPTT